LRLALLAWGILFTLGLFGVMSASPGIDAKASKSQLTCQELAFAADAYMNQPANPDHQLPTCVGDLIHPPWGGPSLYRHGAEEPRDPWGNPFRMEHRQMPDGSRYLLFWAAKPDGTRISQFGIGRTAEPRQ
jgi:hypothetical protein